MEVKIKCDIKASVPLNRQIDCLDPATFFLVIGSPLFYPPVLLCRCPEHPFHPTDGCTYLTEDEALIFIIMNS
jgi:hypothetical protein